MIITGKTVEDAVKEGLEKLGITRDQAEITVIDEEQKGLFKKKNAVVEVVAKEKPEEVKETKTEKVKTEKVEKAKSGKKDNSEKKAKKPLVNNGEDKGTVDFTLKVLSFLGVKAEALVKETEDKKIITLSANDSNELIGKRGEVLDAIQTLAGAKENIGNTTYRKVVVDCGDYRSKREETLINLAKKLEKKATEIKRDVILEPMNPFERRIIHTALANSQTVTTKSEGVEPNRYVMICPNDKDEFSRPYNAARNNNHKKGGHGRNGGKKPERKGSGFIESKKTSFGFGTYLGNSLKGDK